MFRRMILVLSVVALMAAMMAATATAAFAAPKGEQTPENSCGASNPNIGDFPPNRFNKDEETGSGQFADCGFRNNPVHTPPGQPGGTPPGQSGG